MRQKLEKLADTTLSINSVLSLSYSSTPTSSLDPYSPCNNNCECQTDSFTPVCGADGVTYLSACFAGCSSTVSGLSGGPLTCGNGSGSSSEWWLHPQKLNSHLWWAGAPLFHKCPLSPAAAARVTHRAGWDLTTSCPGLPPQHRTKEHDRRSAQVSSGKTHNLQEISSPDS